MDSRPDWGRWGRRGVLGDALECTKAAEMEKEHLEELETHVELKETQLQHLEEENRSLMQRLGLKKPS